MKHKKILTAALSLLTLTGIFALTGCGSSSGTEQGGTSSERGDHGPEADDMTALSAMETVQDMGLGINLGNTFEACGSWINGSSVQNYETAWAVRS